MSSAQERFEAWRESVTKGGTACIGVTYHHALRRCWDAAYAAGAEDMRERAAMEVENWDGCKNSLIRIIRALHSQPDSEETKQ